MKKNPFLRKLFKTEMYKRFNNERLMKKSDNRNVVLPEVGMGATTGAGSDCYPHTIIEVAPDFSYIIIQDDNYEAKTKNNPYGSYIEYNYTPNPNGSRHKYTLRKNGRYIVDGAPLKAYYCSVSVGFRRYHQDPHF